MSKIEVNQISSQCGSTLTIGQSGDTVTLACGATQSGFGRTGTVDWDTTAKTASFTAVSGNGYFVNTTSGVITVTLPATPSAGDIVAVSDYAQTSETNNITIARNGSNIQGDASDLVIQRNGVAMTLVFVDATKGWIVTDTGAESDKDPIPIFITATGGTITCCGDYKIHTFTGPGTFTVSCAGNPTGSNTVDYLVVAGGGSGGNGHVNNNCGPGGGGAGGFRESSGAASGCYTASPLGSGVSALPVTVQGYPIIVGAGGTAAGPGEGPISTPGSNSVFSTITSTGGGYGGNATPAPPSPAYPGIPGKNTDQGGDGGSGGGGARITNPTSGGTGNTPPVSPPQGNPGGTGSPGAGGGGATAAGTGGVDSSSVGNGGAGATTSISGSSTAYAGGGGAGHTCGEPAGGTGGIGGGGPGGLHGPTAGCAACTQGTAGTANTGGGGGGQGGAASISSPATSGAGGSGIVIIRYKFQ
jgi:hypothetical protein